MSLIVKENAGSSFEPIPAGMHHAVCYGIVDLGTQPGGQFPDRRKVAFLFEVPAERQKGGDKDLPRTISQMFTLSLSPKGSLRPSLESWRGRAFTTEELAGFDLKSVLGANCFINVVHAAGSGANSSKTYANIKSINPVAKGMPKLKAETALVWFSLDECPNGIIIPPTVPEWLKIKILGSSEALAEPIKADPSEDEMANTTTIMSEDVPF